MSSAKVKPTQVDQPAQQGAIHASQLHMLIASEKQLVSLANGEKRWVVFVSDIKKQADDAVRPFVAEERLSADYFSKPHYE